MGKRAVAGRVGKFGGLGAAGLVALGGAATGVVRVATRRSLPQTEGRLTVDGVAAPVRVRRDGHGVPHIDASSVTDAAFAMGVVHAQDRLWQLETTRRVVAGRLAEFAGPTALVADRFLRRLGLMAVAESEADALRGEARNVLEAYAAGVNTIIEAPSPLPVEFRICRIRPEPWRPADSLAAAKLLNLALAMNWDTEWQRLRLLRAIGPDRAARLNLVYRDSNPTILEATAQAGDGAVEGFLDGYEAVARWLPAHHGGSNSWVVAGSRTTSGHPLLVNDPHLLPGVPSTWYEAHVRIEGDFHSYGATVAGLPFPIIGHNRDIAWGYTNSFADVQDLVIEEFDSSQGLRYRTESGWADTHVRREVIRVRGAPGHVEDVLTTRHGPIVERLDTAGSARGLALQWTVYEPGNTAAALLALQRAVDFESFRAAHALVDGPSQNAVYADRAGHIGYLTTGRIPVRRNPSAGLPVAGWTGEAAWERYLTSEEVPQALDPPGGVLVTANNRIVGPAFPHYITLDYMNGYRALRIRELLGEGKLDAADMRSIQLDIECPPAREVRDLLAELGPVSGAAEGARRRLTAWDAHMAADSEDPLLYEMFTRRLLEHALRPLCGEHWRILAGRDTAHPIFEYPGNLLGRLLPDLLARWRQGDESLFEEITTWRDVASQSLADAAADLGGQPTKRRQWGRAHRLRLTHPVARGLRPLGALLNLGSFSIGGNSDTVLATCHNPDKPFETALWAPSWRQVLDPSDWDASTAVHLGGQSGMPGSPHRRDLIDDWRANRQHPLAWSADAVAAVTRAELMITPRAVSAAEKGAG